MTFTRTLSHDEQRQLTPEQGLAYCQWFAERMGRPMKSRLHMDDPSYLDGDYSRVGSYKATRWGR